MPFPKSSSIAARATEVYSETWGAILHKCWSTPLSRKDDLSDLFQLLPYLRQLLTCCACAGLLENAMISITCGHCYCYDCQFRPPLLKIQCRQCRERSGLVNENQLRMIVQGYKHLCSILAEMLNQNPLILKSFETPSSCSENSSSEGNRTSAENSSTSEEGKKESCVKGSGSQTSRGSELKVSETGTQIEFQKGKGTVSVDADFDPIAEIIKEVQHGVKVPRSVLVVKPPLKYLNIKAPTSTPKKESKEQTPSSASATSGSLQSQSHTTQKSKTGKKSKLNISTKFSKVANNEEKPVETEKVTEVPQERAEESPVEVKRAKKRGKRPKQQTEKLVGGTPPKQKRRQLVNNEWTRIDNMGTSSEEEIDIIGLAKSTSEMDNVTYEDLTRAKFLLEDLQPSDLEVGEGCLDQEYVNVTPGRLTLKDQIPSECDVFKRLLADGDHMIDTPTATGDSESPVPDHYLTHTRFKQALNGDRQRVWDPLCPKIVVRRSRTAIDKMILLQTKSVRGRLRARERNKSSKQRKAKSKTSSPATTPSKGTMPLNPLPLPPPQIFLPENGSLLNSDDSLMDLEDIFGEDFSLECLRTLEEELPDLDFPPIPPHYPPTMPFPPPPHPHHGPPRYLLPHHMPHPPHGPMVPPPLMLTPPAHPFHPPIIIPAKPNKIANVPGSTAVGKLKTPDLSKQHLSPASSSGSGISKKRKSPGYSESGWRCRCGTNSVMFPEKVCAKGKCPCFSKGIPCKNCLCRTCHNPFNTDGPAMKPLIATVSNRELIQNKEKINTNANANTNTNVNTNTGSVGSSGVI